MNSNNFVPSSIPRQRQVNYTDGSPSREVEEEEHDEEMEKFKKGFGYKKPSIGDVRDELNNIIDLLHVISSAVLTPDEFKETIRIYNAIQINIIPRIKELEQELKNL